MHDMLVAFIKALLPCDKFIASDCDQDTSEDEEATQLGPILK